MGRSSLVLVTLFGLMAIGPVARAQTTPSAEASREAGSGADASTAPSAPPADSSPDQEPGDRGTLDAVAQAERHFLRALEYYRNGDYEATAWELHWAAYLDPSSKDLEYNLALVHEKRGELLEAIEHWERYRTLETSPVERERATITLERLEAVRVRSLESSPGDHSDREPAEVVDPRGAAERSGHFRRWAVGAGIVTAAALCAGIFLGVRALTLDPDRSASHSGVNIEELDAQARRAHAYAVGADVAFSVGVGAGVATGLFWFAEPDDQGAGVAVRSSPSAQALGFSLGGAF